MISLAKGVVALTFFSMFWIPKAFMVSVTGMRPEDFIGFIAIILLPFFYINTYKNISSKFILSIIIYLLYILLISIIRNPEHFIYILILFSKELSYVASFFIFYYTFHRLNFNKSKKFFRILSILTLPPMLYGLIQILTLNFSGMYGLSIYGHEQSPASNGLLFLFIFIFLTISSKSIIGLKINIIIFFISGFLVLLTGSKIAVLGLITFMIGNFLLDSKIQTKMLGVVILSLTLIIVSILISSGLGALNRYYAFSTPIEVIINRGIWWKVEWIDGIVGNITGMGLGAGHISERGEFSLGMAMDNFYLYCYIVLGLFGTLFFIAVLWNLIKAFPSKTIEKKFNISILFSFLAMGMGAEIFQLSISGLLFWSMSGTLLALSKNKEWILFKSSFNQPIIKYK